MSATVFFSASSARSSRGMSDNFFFFVFTVPPSLLTAWQINHCTKPMEQVIHWSLTSSLVCLSFSAWEWKQHRSLRGGLPGFRWSCFIHPYPMFVWWVQRASLWPLGCPLAWRKKCNKTSEKRQGEGAVSRGRMLGHTLICD